MTKAEMLLEKFNESCDRIANSLAEELRESGSFTPEYLDHMMEIIHRVLSENPMTGQLELEDRVALADEIARVVRLKMVS